MGINTLPRYGDHIHYFLFASLGLSVYPAHCEWSEWSCGRYTVAMLRQSDPMFVGAVVRSPFDHPTLNFFRRFDRKAGTFRVRPFFLGTIRTSVQPSVHKILTSRADLISHA
jgi:hypothetical protein